MNVLHSPDVKKIPDGDELLRLFMEHVPGAIAMLDTNMRYLQVSDRWLSDHHLGEVKIIGRSHYEVFPEIPEHWKEVHRRCLAGAVDESKELPFPRADGRVDWVRREIRPWRTNSGDIGGIIIFSEVITERKQADERLRESEARFQAMIEQSITGTCIVDEQMRFAYVNPRLITILGHDSEESIAGHPVLEFVAPESRDLVKTNMLERMAGKTQNHRYSFQAIRMDGSRITLGAQGTLGNYLGKRVVISSVQDVTELKRAEDEIQRTIVKLKQAVHGTIEVISTIGEVRDPYTSGHQRRVGAIAAAIAEEMGLQPNHIEGVRIAGYVHDIGKIGIPADILAKPTTLSDAELDLIKEHARQSYEILKRVEFPWPVAEAAWQHHERLDGSGYPRGLQGDQIILEARILAVADTVEAMGSHRPYRPAVGMDQVLTHIEKGRDTLFDGATVDACLRLFREKSFILPA